jgi:branched-chain amino acid aminotransferase
VISLAQSARIVVKAEDLTLPHLYNATEAFVTGTMGGLVPVVAVDGRVIGGGVAPGPVTKHLMELYAELTSRSGTVVA